MLLLRWLFNALALMLIANFITGWQVDSLYAALAAALILGLVNAVIRPIFILLTLPINILTLGLFTFVINALMILFVSSFVKGFTVIGFSPALAGALLLWLISLVLSMIFYRD